MLLLKKIKTYTKSAHFPPYLKVNKLFPLLIIVSFEVDIIFLISAGLSARYLFVPARVLFRWGSTRSVNTKNTVCIYRICEVFILFQKKEEKKRVNDTQ